MPVRRFPTARAVAPIAWLGWFARLGWSSLLAGGCTFEAFGLGSATQDPGSESSAGDSGQPTTGSAESSSSSSSTATTSGPTTGAEVCPDGCPPGVGWTAIADRVGHAVALDPGGDVVVAGDQAQLDDAEQRDVWVARFAGGDGQLVWEQRYNGGERRGDFARAVVVLDDGRIVAGGVSQEVQGHRQDVWVGWYDADGGLLNSGNLGTAKWDGANIKLDESMRSLTLDAGGELIAGGTRCQSPCQVPDAWIGRFSREGVAQWSEPMLVCGPGALRAVAPLAGGLLAVGTDGYVESTAPWRSLIRSFDASGAGTWSALQEAPGAAGFEALGVAVAGDGALWVVGRELDGETVSGGFVRQYRPGREFMPVQERRGEDLDGEAMAIVVVADGSIVVTGTAGPTGAPHLWLGGFSDELEPVWRIDEPGEAVSSGRAMAQDPDGVVVLGQINARRISPASTWLRRYLYQR